MNKETVNWTKKQLWEHLQRLNERAEELKAEHPVDQPVVIFGVTVGRQRVGYEFRPPLSIRDEIAFVKEDIRLWTTIQP